MIRKSWIALSLLLMLPGCALFGIETGYRSLTIRDHRFDPTQITVPEGYPFILTIDAIDDRDLVIAAPELGFDVLRIPASPKSLSPIVASRPTPSRSARIPMGALKAGSYQITCDCHGHPTKAVLVAR